MQTIGNLVMRLQEARQHINAQHSPGNTDGYITIARKDKTTGRFAQEFYRQSELENQVATMLGEDVFFSQNTFYRKARRIETIRQLRSLYVDLDFYRTDYTEDQVMYWLEEEHFNVTIPEPNLVIFSGQGLVLIWTIEPVPYKALPLWQAIQNYLINQLRCFGGDPRAADAARIFRLAGTTSSKNGRDVRVEYRHDYQYSLREIQEGYLPELKRQESHEKRPGRKPRIVRLFNLYTLNGARLQDLDRLVTMRNGDMGGCREITLFLYRYWSCCFTQDPESALSQTLDFNRRFTHPLREREAVRATESAEKAYKAKTDKEANERAQAMGYPGAGYKVSNKKIIEWLGITEEEQQKLQTIISKKEKNRRKRLAYHENREEVLKKLEKKRRQEGVRTMAEYQSQRKEASQELAARITTTLDKYPELSNRKIAQMLGISEISIRRIKSKKETPG